jgi:hypothetical protein
MRSTGNDSDDYVQCIHCGVLIAGYFSSDNSEMLVEAAMEVLRQSSENRY